MDSSISGTVAETSSLPPARRGRCCSAGPAGSPMRRILPSAPPVAIRGRPAASRAPSDTAHMCLPEWPETVLVCVSVPQSSVAECGLRRQSCSRRGSRSNRHSWAAASSPKE